MITAINSLLSIIIMESPNSFLLEIANLSDSINYTILKVGDHSFIPAAPPKLNGTIGHSRDLLRLSLSPSYASTWYSDINDYMIPGPALHVNWWLMEYLQQPHPWPSQVGSCDLETVKSCLQWPIDAKLRRLQYFEYLVVLRMIRSHHLMTNFATSRRDRRLGCCWPIVAIYRSIDLLRWVWRCMSCRVAARFSI